MATFQFGPDLERVLREQARAARQAAAAERAVVDAFGPRTAGTYHSGTFGPEWWAFVPWEARPVPSDAGDEGELEEAEGAFALEPLTDGTLPRAPMRGARVYLSVGEHRREDETCDESNQGSCGLYELEVDLNPVRVVSVRPVVIPSAGCTGAIQPALSPSGMRVAYVEKVFDSSGEPVEATLRVIRRDGTRPVDIDAGSSGPDFPQFPNFYGRGDLLFHKSTKEIPGDLWRAVAPWPTTSPAQQLGRWTDFSWKDVNAHPAPEYGGAVQPAKIVTFGGEDGAQVPIVSTIYGGDVEEFVLGENASGRLIEECHHPAWNATGDRILCTAHAPASARSETDGTQAQGLYEYEHAAGQWQRVGINPLFVPPGNTELAAALPAFASVDCHTLTYKFAEWCGGDRYVLFTLFCTTADGVVTASRVVLGDSLTGDMYDLSEAVENSAFGTSGQARAVFGTCWRAAPSGRNG